jgi:hypothetical protein
MGALQTYNPGQFLELISQDPKASADFRYLPETDKLESNTIEVTEICTKRLFVGNVTKYGQTGNCRIWAHVISRPAFPR